MSVELKIKSESLEAESLILPMNSLLKILKSGQLSKQKRMDTANNPCSNTHLLVFEYI